jgi:hypothetical protein
MSCSSNKPLVALLRRCVSVGPDQEPTSISIESLGMLHSIYGQDWKQKHLKQHCLELLTAEYINNDFGQRSTS